MFIAKRPTVSYMIVYGRRDQPTPFKTQRPLETSNKKWSCTMTFLPKSAEVRQELLTLLIAVPMSLIGTGFLFFLADVGNRAIGA